MSNHDYRLIETPVGHQWVKGALAASPHFMTIEAARDYGQAKGWIK